MMNRLLIVPEGYDAAVNPRVASFAAQLDDRLAALKKATSSLERQHLEWQSHQGVNTIGMLLAHLAVVDVWWLQIAPLEASEAEADAKMQRVIGISMDDDGLPLPKEGTHPKSLADKSIADYFHMVDAARTLSHQELTQWSDSDLEKTYRLKDNTISREWTVYHVIEHFCSHLGQILLLKHLMRDAGILKD